MKQPAMEVKLWWVSFTEQMCIGLVPKGLVPYGALFSEFLNAFDTPHNLGNRWVKRSSWAYEYLIVALTLFILLTFLSFRLVSLIILSKLSVKI